MKLLPLTAILISQFLIISTEENSNLTLELVQVIFRHGARTPLEREYNTYKYIDASSYKPYEFGELTKIGKQQEYEIGLMLRERYNNFLNTRYNRKDVYADASDKGRTKMSLQMVFAGLYPPTNSNSWSQNLNWIPIPYKYIPQQFDVLLQPQKSSKYEKILENSRQSASFREQASVYKDLIDFLNNKTGNNFDPSDLKANDLFGLLTCNEYLQLPLPEWYTPEVQRKFQEYAEFTWTGCVYTEEMKRLIGGPLLKTFIQNLNVFDSVENPRKIYLYSGHDTNLVAVSNALGVDLGYPSFGSALILEKLRDSKKRLFVRLLSWKRSEGLRTLNLANHKDFCPIEDFLKLAKDFIPSDEEMNYLLEDLNLDHESITKIKNILLRDPVLENEAED